MYQWVVNFERDKNRLKKIVAWTTWTGSSSYKGPSLIDTKVAKTSIKKWTMLFQNSSLSFHVVQVVKYWLIFLEFNS